MIPEWNHAKYTVICEACCDMELNFTLNLALMSVDYAWLT